MSPTTTSEIFIDWMNKNGLGVFGSDIFLNQIPKEANDSAYWIVTSGGDVTQKLVTGESVQLFNVAVNYRSRSGDDVEKRLHAVSRVINNRATFELSGVEIFSAEASMPEDNDIDAENRKQGSFVVRLEIYVSYS